VLTSCDTSQVLQEKGALTVLEQAVRKVALAGFVGISCRTGRDRAWAIGEVATDWVSRHLGYVRVYHWHNLQSLAQQLAGLLACLR